MKSLSQHINESMNTNQYANESYSVAKAKPGATVKVGKKKGTIVSNLPNDDDEISVDFDGNVEFVSIDDIVMLNESVNVDIKSTQFSGSTSVDIFVSDMPTKNRDSVEIWVNGGNAFNFTQLTPEQVAKMSYLHKNKKSPDTAKFKDGLMKAATDAMSKFIDTFTKGLTLPVVNESAKTSLYE